MLLDTWLFVAERDGVAVRQPIFVDALERAISALHATLTVRHAIALLRLTRSSAGAKLMPTARVTTSAGHR
jgi:hypothetical protein